MRPPADALSDDPAWPLVQSWIEAAHNEVAVLPAERALGEDTLRRLEVTDHSVLGAVALETGGILIDHGWLRLLGSGSEPLRGASPAGTRSATRRRSSRSPVRS